jgi:RNA polymerase sigma-70 factor (ECF subfamily)
MEDEALIAGTLAGRHEDFAVLVERYQKMLYAFAYRQLGDADAAGEVVQTAFVRAYSSLGRFRGDAGFKTWLHQIALNEIRSRYRGERRRAETSLDEVSEAVLAAGDGDTSRRAERSQLQALIARLPPRQRAVLNLRVFSDLPFKEIAAVEGISENSAKVSYHHAVTRLREWMK